MIHSYPNFKDLKVSTRTIEIYTNLNLDLPKLFNNLPIHKLDNIPLTKKKKRPDIKKIFAPVGSIIGIRMFRNSVYNFRGVDTRPEKCLISELRIKRDKGELNSDEQKTLQNLESVHKKNVLDFQNQICIIMNVGTRTIMKNNIEFTIPVNLNIMTFRNGLKLVGCKTDAEVYTVIGILWGHINEIQCHRVTDKFPPRFIIDPVMTNLDFQLGFKVNRRELNNILNDPKYSSIIFTSNFEPTSHTNVKVRMKKYPPEGWEYNCLIFPYEKEINKYELIKVSDNPYQDPKNKKKCSKFHTFLIPRSSKVIVSGKYLSLLEEHYNYFIHIVEENREKIEEINDV